MSNTFYNPSGNPATGSEGLSALIRSEFAAIGTAFDSMPRITTTGLSDTVFAQQGSYTFTLPSTPGTLALRTDVDASVAAEATARAAADALLAPLAGPHLTGTTTIDNAVIAAGAVNGTTIGATTRSSGAFTTLAASGAVTASGTLNVTGTLTAAAGANIGGNMGVTGQLNANGGLAVTGGATATGPVTSTGGRVISQLAGQASVTAYNTSAPAATGMSTNSIGQMVLGSCDGAGTPVATWMTVTANQVNFPGASDFAAVASGGSKFLYYTTTGNFYWQYTNATGDLQWVVAGTPQWFMRVSDGLCYNNRAAVAGHGPYVDLCDARAKQDVGPSPYGLAEILRLNPVRFRRIITDRDAMPEIGFVAQEVQSIIPEAVLPVGFGGSGGAHGIDSEAPMLGLSEASLIPVLVKAVQVLAAKVAALEAR